MNALNTLHNTKLKKKSGLTKPAVIFILALVILLIGSISYYLYIQQKKAPPIIPQIPVDQSSTQVEKPPASESITLPPIDDTPQTPAVVQPDVPTFCPIEKTIKQATAKTNYQIYGGTPSRLKQERNFTILKNIAFTVGYSEKRDNPLWVAYRVDKTDDPLFFKRPSYFKSDNRTIARIKSKDYTKSGYDRGHMAPNAAIVSRYGRQAQLETFSMSNIIPQKPKLNRGVWKRLEGLEMKYSNKLDKVWVITGPIFDEHIEKIKEKVEIPDKFFKILIDEKRGAIRTIQFIIPQNVKGKERLEDFLTSIDQIEKEANIDFFGPLSDRYESYLESKKPNRLWDL